MTPLYSVGTWDMDLQAYTPQDGVEKSLNLTAGELRTALHQLRRLHYSAHRRGNANNGHDDNDWTVLIERTDGKLESDILKQWER
jgi:hypothetical protein